MHAGTVGYIVEPTVSYRVAVFCTFMKMAYMCILYTVGPQVVQYGTVACMENMY